CDHPGVRRFSFGSLAHPHPSHTTIPNTGMPHKYMAAIISTTAIKSMITPALTMSTIRSELLPKIIALGGVAIGIIKAIEAATVTGTINRSGGIPELSEIPAMIGNTISVVAVLE